LRSLAGEVGEPVTTMLESLCDVVFRLVGLVMKAAPIGAFGAMAFTIGKYGIGALLALLGLVATFYFTSALFVLVVLGLVARVCGFSILRLIAYLKTELLLVLGTSSSESALPGLISSWKRRVVPRPSSGWWFRPAIRSISTAPIST
jgi:aerobic C4-dicarboxylate transport protein